MDFKRPERCQRQRTGREDRRSNFYEMPDNLAPSLLPPSTTPVVPLVKPLVQDTRESAKKWREGNKLARIDSERKPAGRKRGLPVGTTFSFTLNEQASAAFSFTQTVTGRNVGHECVAKTRTNAKHKVCKRTVTAGTLSFTGHSATNRVVFQGHISRSEKLKPGRYTLVITATNTAGKKSTPQKLGFTIVK